MARFPRVPAMMRFFLVKSSRLLLERPRYRSKTRPFAINETEMCKGKGAGVPRKTNPFTVPKIVALHFLPVRDTRIAKNAGNRKNRSRERVAVLNSTLETYPYSMYRAVSAATNATNRDVVDVGPNCDFNNSA